MITTTLGIDAVNEVIAEYGARHKAFVLGERRDQLRSFLFDVPRRSIVGWEVVYEHAGWLLRDITDTASPEEISRRMKRVGARPYYLQVAMLLCGYLATRQLRIHELGLGPADPFPEERLDDLALVCDFSVRVARSLREDGLAFPDPGGGPHPVLDEAGVREVEALMVRPDEAGLRRIGRLAATAGMYALLLHGEQRDGLTGHGPTGARRARRSSCWSSTTSATTTCPGRPGSPRSRSTASRSPTRRTGWRSATTCSARSSPSRSTSSIG